MPRRALHGERYRALVEHGREGKLLLDASGVALYANEAAAAILGSPVERVRGRNALELLHPQDTAASSALLRRMVDAPAQEHVECVEMRHPNGTSRQVELRVANQLSVANVEALVVTVIDVPRREHDEPSHADSELRYRDLFDHSLDGVLRTAPDGTIHEANDAFLTMLGYTQEETRERPLHRTDVLDETDARLPMALEERHRTGSFRGELNFKHRNGSIVPAELTTNVVEDESGHAWTSMIVRDARPRHRAERALMDHEAHLARAEQAALVIVARNDLDGRFLKVPPALCELLGYSEQELLSSSFQEISHPDDLDEELYHVQRLLDGECASFELEQRCLRKDGSTVWVRIVVSLVSDEDGAPQHFSVYVRDITAERAVDERAHARFALLLQQVTGFAEQMGLARDHAGVYRALLELARTTTPAEALLVSRFDPDSRMRTCVFAGEFVGERYEEYEESDLRQLPPMPLHDSPQSRAVLEGRAVVTEDLLGEPVPAVDFGSDDDDRPARSSIAIPLVVLGETIGVFELQSPKRGAFGEEHVAKLQVAANLAAIATKNVDLLARQRSARRRAETQAARLQAVLEQAPMLTAVLEGPEHVFAMANDRYVQLFDGRSIVGRRVVDVMPEIEAQGIIAVLDDVYATGESFVAHEFCIELDTRGDGNLQSVYFDLVYQPVRDENDGITGVLVQAVEITAQVEGRKRAEELHEDLQAAYDGTIAGWARALDLKDEETAGHSQRVTDLTVELGRRMGMNEEELVHVHRGALLHDIGKMGVPDRILLKPGKLDAEEWEIVKRHPVNAWTFLHPIEHLRPALDIPYCHHEKWDGSGYPRGLAGEAIPLAARIFAIVDVYDALTSDRPYRAAWPREEALSFIAEQGGSHFDPRVVDAFLDLATGDVPEAAR